MSNQLIHPSHFIRAVENLPVNSDELIQDIRDAIEVAKKRGRCEILSYAGLFDIFVNPNGSFSFIPVMSFPIYTLTESDGRVMLQKHLS